MHIGSSIFLCKKRPGKCLLTPAGKFVKILRAKAIRLSTKFSLKSCFQVDAKDREPKESKTCYQKVTKSEWTMNKGLRFNWKFNLQILEMPTRKIQEGAGGTPKDSRTVFKKISEQYTRSSCSQVKSGSTNQRASNCLSNGPKIEGIWQVVVEIWSFKWTCSRVLWEVGDQRKWKGMQ